VVPVPDPTIIAPVGELDLARVGDFRIELADAAGRRAERVVVDLSAVSFIDSSGLSALVELHNRLRRDRRELAVVVPGGTAARVVLSLCGLQTRLAVFETRQAALEH
jgi:anti-sigma B factor antagonist